LRRDATFLALAARAGRDTAARTLWRASQAKVHGDRQYEHERIDYPRSMSTAISSPRPHLQGQRRPRWLAQSRQRALLVHLGFSAIAVAVACALIFLVWYPHPYFHVVRDWTALQVLIAVDLVVGPMLMLIALKSVGKHVGIYVVSILVAQLAALISGTAALYRDRPYFNVFAVDRFTALAWRDVDAAQWARAKASIGDKPFLGPLLVVALRPTDIAGQQRLIDETVLGDKPDIERRPEFWVAYEEHVDEIEARAKPLGSVRSTRPDIVADVASLPARLGVAEGRLGVVPLIASDRYLSFVIDTEGAAPLEVLDVDPWTDE
jgi:hypothetical protein